MTEGERQNASIALEELTHHGDSLTAHLARVLLDVVDWQGEDEPQLDQRIAGERLLPIVVGSEKDHQPPSGIIERLAWIARQLAADVPFHAEFWGGLQGIICDLAAHAAGETAAERGEMRLVDAAPLVDLGRRCMLMSAVGIVDGPLLTQVVDRALRVLERSKPRRLLVVLEDANRLGEPALRQLAEECSARRIGLEPIIQLFLDGRR